MKLLQDIHEGLDPPPNCDEIIVSSGYEYYHYNCDGVDDRGWGCGYRTLQTVCSWISSKAVSQPVPSLQQIQEILVTIGDKEKGFVGSKEWIGSVEVGLVIDKLYNIPCKILHVSNGYQLNSHIQEIRNHFLSNQSILMMGGESDTSSKGIVGLATSCLTSDLYLLVLDPHYYELSTLDDNEQTTTKSSLQRDGWIQWRNINSFHLNTFYNICLPQTKILNMI
ncbi:UFSP1 [Bugula neritina]|uniref:UFSP1 n=1 Tax=Bugula neritina TaxID=10212 RepID=A0A7J7JY48_BUGNE|nr:UFSP1 [Bugula neritina]